MWEEASPPPHTGNHVCGLEGDTFPNIFSVFRDASQNHGSPRPHRRPPRKTHDPRAGRASRPGGRGCGRARSALRAARAAARDVPCISRGPSPRNAFSPWLWFQIRSRSTFCRISIISSTGSHVKITGTGSIKTGSGVSRASCKFPIPGSVGTGSIVGLPGGPGGARSVAEGDPG